MNENAIVEQGDLLNTDIVEIPANDCMNDDIDNRFNYSKKHLEELT